MFSSFVEMSSVVKDVLEIAMGNGAQRLDWEEHGGHVGGAM